MLLDEILRDKKLVFDIGANIGSKTELFLKYGVKVICVEPQKDCLSVLYTKFKDKDVDIVPSAISSDGTDRKFRVSSANTLSTFSETFIDRTVKERFKNYKWGEPTDIKTITMDMLIEKYGLPDFCKIDVEGSEKEVLLGLSKPIPYISFEYTPELHDVAVDCIALIAAIGDYSFNYSEGESLKFSSDLWLKKGDIENYMLSIRNSIVFGDLYAKIEV